MVVVRLGSYGSQVLISCRTSEVEVQGLSLAVQPSWPPWEAVWEDEARNPVNRVERAGVHVVDLDRIKAEMVLGRPAVVSWRGDPSECGSGCVAIVLQSSWTR